jgi:hypothetical protein
MTSLGPFLLGAPLALAALIALPIIWWILRATPPAPKNVELPSMRLLDDVKEQDETPARTPWWVWLLRTLAAAAAIIGLSQPVYAPGASSGDTSEGGALLIVLDNGWPSAPRWNELVNASVASLDAGGRDAPAHLLLTAPQQLNPDPSQRFSKADMAKRLTSLRPQAWGTDRTDALTRLKESSFAPARILWASDGLESEDGRSFANALSQIAPLSVYAAPPRGPVAITRLQSQTDSVDVTLRRLEARGTEDTFVSALTLDGSALATAEAVFEDGNREAIARFELPAAALSRVARFAATGKQGAGTVWLWDSSDRSRRVGLVDAGASAQPLLSDMHYIRKALEPFASITEGDLESLVAASPDAIVMTDVGQIAPDDVTLLTEWVEQGGALIRFSGPRLATQGDDLLPVPLRRAARALGGSLAWDEPQALAGFPDTSPFSGLTPPADVRVRQQVLAKPAADLADRTWARLEDGSPLVTAAPRGSGTIVLFHITAGPGWSDLAYSGVFSQMLRRSIAAGRGEALDDVDGSYAPQLALDGYGRLQPAPASAAPLRASEFSETRPSEAHPPGLYQGPAGTRVLNAAANLRPSRIENWPASARLLGDAETRSLRLAGPLLTLAVLLLAIDLFVALFVAGKLNRRIRKPIAALIGLGLMGSALPHTETAQAQSYRYQQMPDGTLRRIEILPDAVANSNTIASSPMTPEMEAALEMRFGYVKTSDSQLDQRTMAGLTGLSRLLYMRTSVEPAAPHALDVETAPLELYPLIYFNVPDNNAQLSDTAVSRLNAYLRSGGALIIDTRAGAQIGTETDVSRLETVLSGLDAPPLQPVPQNHVLARSYYLIDDFPGRYAGRRLWIEETGSAGAPRGDGVSRLFIGDADWASAWATDERGRDLYSVDGGPRQREIARRFGINLAMYVLTGNYKDDQVHLPALLERLGDDDDATPRLPAMPNDGGP